MTKISVVIITLNEEENIVKCIQSVKEIADEILVIDSYSTDNTATLAEQQGAKVVKQIWKGFAQTKNTGNAMAKHAYVLSLDADEALSPQLSKSILAAKQNLQGAYSFNRLNFYRHMPVRYCGWYPDKKIRLFPKTQCQWQGDYVHEKLHVPSNIAVSHLKGDLFHYTLNSTQKHAETIEKYATLAAQELIKKKKTISPLAPYLSYSAMFLKKYFLQFGLLEGSNGWYISHYSAKSRFLKYKKAIQLIHSSNQKR